MRDTADYKKVKAEVVDLHFRDSNRFGELSLLYFFNVKHLRAET